MSSVKSIQPFIQRKVVVLHEDDSIEQAAHAMKDHRIGCVIVADHRRHIVGILTDRDIVNRAVAWFGEGRKTMIREVMTRNPVSVGESASVKQVIEAMEKNGVRRIPILQPMPGDTQYCIGVVTLDDLVASRVIGGDRLGRIVRSQMKRKLLPAKLEQEPSKEREMFLDRLAAGMGSKLELTRGELEQLTTLVLSGLVRRLHHTGALKLIDALPGFMQSGLLAQPPGPDESVDLRWLANEVSRLFNVDDPSARVVLMRFGALLEELCDKKALEHSKAQLPQDLRSIFSPTEFEHELKKGAA